MRTSRWLRPAAQAAMFPSDQEVRRALGQSGMGWPAVECAMSQALRLLRWDFGLRRKRRVYSLAVVRMGMMQLKELLVGIITRHLQQTGNPVSLDDLAQGNDKEMLVDFGPAAIDRALSELAREGIVRREKRGIVEVIRPTGKHYHAGSLGALRRVIDEMRRKLNVRYATEYDTARTFRV